MKTLMNDALTIIKTEIDSGIRPISVAGLGIVGSLGTKRERGSAVDGWILPQWRQ